MGLIRVWFTLALLGCAGAAQACDRCDSGYALKVIEEALQKSPQLPNERVAEVERLRAESELLFEDGNYADSLELSRKAQSLLGIDRGGASAPSAQQ